MDKFDRLQAFYMDDLKDKGRDLHPGRYLALVSHIGREVEMAREGRQTTTQAAEQIEYAFHLKGLPTELFRN